MYNLKKKYFLKTKAIIKRIGAKILLKLKKMGFVLLIIQVLLKKSSAFCTLSCLMTDLDVLKEILGEINAAAVQNLEHYVTFIYCLNGYKKKTFFIVHELYERFIQCWYYRIYLPLNDTFLLRDTTL